MPESGEGIDRGLIRDALQREPRERLRYAASAARAVSRMQPNAEDVVSAFDPVPPLRALFEHGATFVVIGDVAASHHGSAMIPFGLELCFEPSRPSLERLAETLRSLGASLRGADEDVPFILDAQTLRNGDSFTFTTRYGSVDILATPSGTTGYDDLAAGADLMDLGDGLSVLVTALDDLIRMKRAAGRPKDRIAVEWLTALRDERSE